MKQEMAGQSSAKQIRRDKTRSARAVNSLESDVRDKLLRRIAELEATKAVGQQQLAKLTAKNNTLNKEVGRLKHVTELCSSSMAASSQSPNNQSNQKPSVSWSNSQRPVGVSWFCGKPGHFANHCGRRSSEAIQNQRKSQVTKLHQQRFLLHVWLEPSEVQTATAVRQRICPRELMAEVKTVS